MSRRGLLRQGDVLLVPVKEVPAALERVSRRRRTVLAEGETTGHAHAVRGDVSLYRRFYFNDAGERYVVVHAPAVLEHEDHDPIALSVGVYEVVRQREYEPARAFRWVAD